MTVHAPMRMLLPVLYLALVGCSREPAATADRHGTVTPTSAASSATLDPRPGARAAVPAPADAVLREIASPLDGRVVRVVAAAGSDVIAGEPLAWISSPAFDDAVARLRAANEAEAAARTRAEAARAAVAKRPPVAGRPDQDPLPEETAHRAARDEREAVALQLRNLVPSGRVGDDTTLLAIRAPEPGRVVASSAEPGGTVRIGGGALFTIAVARHPQTVPGGDPTSGARAAPQQTR